MQVADNDLHVFSDECASQECSKSSACDQEPKCQLCKQCLGTEEIEFLRPAFLVRRPTDPKLFEITVESQFKFITCTKNLLIGKNISKLCLDEPTFVKLMLGCISMSYQPNV